MPSPVKVKPQTARAFLQEVMDKSGQNLLTCYQCRRCAAGCPVGDETGVTPDRLIRMILMGQKDEALDNLLVWQCLSCYTCGARCPNDIQTSSINETLKQMSKKQGRKPLVPKVAYFHGAFVDSAEKLGRISETDFMRMYETRAMIDDLKGGKFGSIIAELLGQASLGMAMMMKKRMHFGSEKIKGLDEFKRLYNKAKNS